MQNCACNCLDVCIFWKMFFRRQHTFRQLQFEAELTSSSHAVHCLVIITDKIVQELQCTLHNFNVVVVYLQQGAYCVQSAAAKELRLVGRVICCESLREVPMNDRLRNGKINLTIMQDIAQRVATLRDIICFVCRTLCTKKSPPLSPIRL